MFAKLDFTVERYQLHPGESGTWVNDAQYPRQRPIRDHHIDFLAYLVDTNTLRPGTEVALGILGGHPYVVNGNHTIRAIQRADKPYWITLTRYQVPDMATLDRLYTTFDRQLPRNARDMLKAYGFSEHSGLSQHQSEVLFGSMRLILSGLVHERPRALKDLGYLRDNERLYVAALQWTDEAKQYCEDIAGSSKQWHAFLLRQPIMAAAIVHYRYEPGRAETFWDLVANESHVDPRHPTRQLAKWLQSQSHRKNLKARDLLSGISLAWNFTYHDRPLRSFTLPSSELPIHFEGTPHSRASVMRYIDDKWNLLDEPVKYDEPFFKKGTRDAA